VRWNAVVDTGGTPPGLKGSERDPDKIEGYIHGVARDHDCRADVSFDRYSWQTYVTLEALSKRADPRRALEVLEAEQVTPLLTADEKKNHPWFQTPTSPQARSLRYDDEGLPPADEVETS
jgi:hypothetical protein